jgi:hypothetical protein
MYDYFRAAGPDAVVAMMDDTTGASVPDAVETKWIDPFVVLGQIIAFSLDEPWSIRLVGGGLLWPRGGRDPEYDGPRVTSIGDRARDALADITEDRMPDLAERWSRVPELSGFGMTPDDLQPLLHDLVVLARTARANGQSLYCWIS